MNLEVDTTLNLVLYERFLDFLILWEKGTKVSYAHSDTQLYTKIMALNNNILLLLHNYLFTCKQLNSVTHLLLEEVDLVLYITQLCHICLCLCHSIFRGEVF